MTKFKLTHNITHKIKSNELSQLDCLNSLPQIKFIKTIVMSTLKIFQLSSLKVDIEVKKLSD